jgi:hypothetical protein
MKLGIYSLTPPQDHSLGTIHNLPCLVRLVGSALSTTNNAYHRGPMSKID